MGTTTRQIVTSLDKARDIRFREWDYRAPPDPHVQCAAPVERSGMGLPDPLVDPKDKALPFVLYARCRKCPGCLTHRRRLWTARARDMIAASRRTWFGTLTVRPEERFKLRILAERKRLRAGGETIDSLDATEQFQLLADALGAECTRWLKRVRAVAKGPFRYLLVTEEHKSGDPHVHLLVHEFGEPIPKRLLEGQWKYGFSHWRLVGDSPNAASYVCKYLSKDLRTRVRASLGYGQADQVRLITERLKRFRDTVSESNLNTVLLNDDDDDDGDDGFSTTSTTTTTTNKTSLRSARDIQGD